MFETSTALPTTIRQRIALHGWISGERKQVCLHYSEFATGSDAVNGLTTAHTCKWRATGTIGISFLSAMPTTCRTKHSPSAARSSPSIPLCQFSSEKHSLQSRDMKVSRLCCLSPYSIVNPIVFNIPPYSIAKHLHVAALSDDTLFR